MPTLPSLDSLGQRPIPVSRRQIATNPAAGVVGQAIESVGDAASKLGAQLSERQDRLAYAAAKSALLKADITTRQELSDDPDYETWGARYTEKMKVAREQAANLLPNHSDRRLFQADAEIDTLRGAGELAGLANGRRHQARVGTLEELLTTNQDLGQNAPDDATREQVILNTHEAIKAAVARGDITPEDGARRSRQWTQGYVMQQVEARKDRGDLDGAMKFFDTHRGMLEPDAEIRLGQQIGDARENRENYLTIDGVFAQPAPSAAAHDPAAPTSAAPSGNTGGYRAAVAHAESSGNPNARNSSSSASGLYGFTNGTWVKTYRAEFPNSGLSDAAIVARKGEVDLQHRMMDRLTADNTAALRGAGHDATPGNLYLAHFAGAGGANKVLSAPDNTSVAALLGSRVVAANPFLANWNVGQLKAWAGQKVGSKAADSGYTPANEAAPDIGTIYSQIDAIAKDRGYTPERTAKLREMGAARVSQIQGVLRQQQDQTFDRALAKADAIGTGFTDVSQLGDDFYKASATDQHRLRAMAEANLASQAAATAPKANSDVVRSLHVMAISDPAKFSGLNLAQYKPFMTAGEFDEIGAAQAKAKADASKGADAWNPRGGITQAMEWGQKFGGVDLSKDDESRYRVYRYIEARARERSAQHGGAAPSENDYQQFFRDAVQEANIPRSFMGIDSLATDVKVRGYKDSHSANYRAMIVRQFRAVNGRDPKDAEIDAWFARMGEPLGGG